VVAVAAGALYNLALKRDGTVATWGDNTAGQTNVPAGLSNVVVLASGPDADHALAIFSPLIVNPPSGSLSVPAFSSLSFGAGGVLQFQWIAPTNEQFQIRWTTNLAPPSWTLFPGTITSPTTNFNFVDTNAPVAMKFYQLILM
jgi:hypothetical protein